MTSFCKCKPLHLGPQNREQSWEQESKTAASVLTRGMLPGYQISSDEKI